MAANSSYYEHELVVWVLIFFRFFYYAAIL